MFPHPRTRHLFRSLLCRIWPPTANFMFENNEFTGTIPASIANCHKLSHLDLKSNLLEGTIPEEIGQLDKLQWFMVNQNFFTGSLPPEICQRKNDGLLIRADFCHEQVSVCIEECSR